MRESAKRADGTMKLGAKVRGLRRRENLSQVQLATRLGISPSYLNLIESNRRPLPAPLLIRLAQELRVDLTAFASDEDSRLVSDLVEAFADPFFEEHGLTSTDVRELVQSSPGAARSVLALYRSYQATRGMIDELSSRLSEGETALGLERSHIPSEEVSDLVQRRMNHFPELDLAAERLWRTARLDTDELYSGLVRHLDKTHGVAVTIVRSALGERAALRRYDPKSKTLYLSELLPTRSRTFQLAYQIALLEQREAIEALAADPNLTIEESRALARIALANYYAGAVLMPYERFLEAAKQQRYDVEVLGRRFRVGFEQVCHRLTTLRRPGAEGVPFHMVRIDVGGNISKRFSASGIRIARYSGACPKWNIFAAFQTPGMIRIQVSQTPEGAHYFCIARTIQRDSGGFHTQQPVMVVGLGCALEHARDLVYSDAVNLESPDIYVQVGTTCRTCERTDCDQRALPSIKTPLVVDENVRGNSLFAMP